MNLKSITLHEVSIPFRFRYGHARAKHNGVRSMICVAQDWDGHTGYGESVPRPYVTGETTESIREEFPHLVNCLLNGTTSFEGFQQHLTNVEGEIYQTSVPACAICSLDLAITDLVANQKRTSVSNLLDGEKSCPELIYTASIGMSSPTKLIGTLLLYRAMGLQHFKVKVGDDNDLERVRIIRRFLGDEVTLFADANGAWNKETAAARIERLIKNGVWAVEEPLGLARTESVDNESQLTDQHFADNAWLQQRLPIPLIADESLISLRCAKRIVASGRISNI